VSVLAEINQAIAHTIESGKEPTRVFLGFDKYTMLVEECRKAAGNSEIKDVFRLGHAQTGTLEVEESPQEGLVAVI